VLVSTNLKTPVGVLSLIAEEDILLAAGFKGIDNLVVRLADEDAKQQIKKSLSIPIISDLVADYFEGDFNSLNGIKVRQPGAKF